MQANSVKQNLTAKVVSALQLSRWGKLLRSVAVVTTLGVSCLTVASPALARPTESEVQNIVQSSSEILNLIRGRLSTYASTIEPVRLTRNYQNLPASKLGDTLFQDLMANHELLFTRLVELKTKLTGKSNEEVFGNFVLHRNAALWADMVPSNIPRARKIDYLIKLQLYLKRLFAKEKLSSDEYFVSTLVVKGTNLHLTRNWLFATSLTGGASYRVNPDYVRKFGYEAYASDSTLNHNLVSFAVVNSALASYSNLLMQRYMSQGFLPLWLSDIALKDSFKDFYNQLSSTKLNLVEFLRFFDQLKKTLGADFFILADSVMKQPYVSTCLKTDFLPCFTYGWEEQLRYAYRFGETFEELRLLWQYARKLAKALQYDFSDSPKAKTTLTAKQRKDVFQLLDQYRKDLNAIRPRLLNIAR